MKASPAQLEREVEEIRARMEPVIAELDHRRHAVMDWGGRIQRRGPMFFRVLTIVIGGAATLRMIAKRSRGRMSNGR